MRVDHRSHLAAALVMVLGMMLTGCPWEVESADITATDGGYSYEPGMDGAGGTLSPEFFDAGWHGEDLRPVPDNQTLCMLRFIARDHFGTRVGEVKALFGGDEQEAQSQDTATLQYRFASSNKLGLCGISLSFKWLDEQWREAPGGGEIKVAQPDYYLERADVQGMPYPQCWPRTEPE